MKQTVHGRSGTGFLRIFMIFFILFGTGVLLVCVLGSCELFNKPLKAELKEYTEKAAIAADTFSGSLPHDAEGVLCLPSSADELHFFIRNPQSYTLETHVNFAEDITAIAEKDYSFRQLSATQIALTFDQAFLCTIDGGTDMNPVFSLYEPKSGRTFDPYSVRLRCNSIPEPPVNTTVYKADGGPDNNTYILCFNMPDLSGIHRDVVRLDINGHSFDVTPGETLNPGISGDAFKTDFNTAYWQPVNQAIPFAGQNKARAVYYRTGVPLSDSETTFTLTLTDSKGLSASITASTAAEKLPPPTASLADGSEIEQNSDGYGQITLTAPLSDATVFYTADNGTSVRTGSAAGSVTVRLPAGTWTVTAGARRNGWVDSELTAFTYLVGTSVLYINGESGDDNAPGTRDQPFKTVSKALSLVTGSKAPRVTLQLLGNSTWSNESASGDSMITVGTGIPPLVIEGYNGQRTLNAQGSGRVLEITGGAQVTITNVVITGGSTASGGGGVHVDSGSLTIKGAAEISGNTAKDAGGGILVENAGVFRIAGSTTIIGNTKNAGGSTAADNVYLAAGKTIIVTGPLDGSHIGVSTETSPTTTVPVIFTSGYGDNNGGTEPSVYFTSDSGITVYKSASNEALLAIQGGGIIPPGEPEELLITCGKTVVTAGDPTVTITVAKAGGETLDISDAPTRLTLYSGGVQVGDSQTGRSFYFTGLPQGTYTLLAAAEYQAINYSAIFIIEVQ